MNARKPPSDTGRTRRVFVAVVIATAAAAVTDGVALNRRHPRSAVAEVVHTMPRMAVPSSDPSLPLASEVLEGVPVDSAEPAPTF